MWRMVRVSPETIDAARVRAGWTKVRLARAASVHTRTLTRALQGESVSASVANRIAVALGLNVQDAVQRP